MRLIILLAGCLLQALPSRVDKSRPKVSNYPAKGIYRGQPARPIITKEFRSFRTMIRNGAHSDVEFAGHYTVPQWGCGTGCNEFVIVDSISGRVYAGFGGAELPFKWLEKHGGRGDAQNGISSEQPTVED